MAAPVRLADLAVTAVVRAGDRVDVLATPEGAERAEVVAAAARWSWRHPPGPRGRRCPGTTDRPASCCWPSTRRRRRGWPPRRPARRSRSAWWPRELPHDSGRPPGRRLAASGWLWLDDPVLKGFKDFLLRGNVVDLAIAVVIGAAFTAVVNAFAADFLTPLIGLAGGGGKFGGELVVHSQHFRWGAFVSQLITFVITAAVVYFAVVLPMHLLMDRRRRGVEPGPTQPTQIELLVEIRDLLRAQQSTPAAPGPGGAVPPRPRPSRPRRPSHSGTCHPYRRAGTADGPQTPRSVASPVRRAVLQVAAVVVGGVVRALAPADVAVVGRPEPRAGGSAGAGRWAGSGGDASG